MYKKKILVIGSMLILSLLLVTQRTSIARGFGSPVPPLFPAPRIITIFDKGLDTRELWIDRYTEVTWINDSNSSVRIRFGKGLNCKEVSASAFPALGIRMQPDRCFVTSSILPKGTLRFRFQEFGDYRYKVEYVGNSEVEHGELKVF